MSLLPSGNGETPYIFDTQLMNTAKNEYKNVVVRARTPTEALAKLDERFPTDHVFMSMQLKAWSPAEQTDYID